jgi:hypothetical protein
MDIAAGAPATVAVGVEEDLAAVRSVWLAVALRD